ncbi:hypothetical protein D3C75_773850 [compost metagenome]
MQLLRQCLHELPLTLRPGKVAGGVMPETHILERRIAVQMLEALFQINVVLVIVRGIGVVHILFHFQVNAAQGIHQGNKTLKIRIDIILDGNAHKIAYRLHGQFRAALGDGGVDAVGALTGDIHIGVPENGEQIGFFGDRIKGGNHQRVGTGDFILPHSP